MCGIVGVASTNPMTVPMKEFFQDLLYHDTIRGPHATGVAAIDTLDRSLVVQKKAVPGDIFLKDEEIMKSLFEFKHNFNIYIGHNRWATSGARDVDANAHPFIHGDIVGVHNGSLRDQRLLDDSEKFVVDSDNLYHHLDKHGLDDTLTKTNGAFALVWYNKEDGTLNFIRNDERPLAIGKLANGCWVWTSEMGMLQWLVKRHKSLSWATYKEGGVEYDLCYNLAAGQHLKFEFTKHSRQIPVPRATKKTLPVFPSSNYMGRWGWGDDYPDQGNNNNRRRPQSSSTDYGNTVREVLLKFLGGDPMVGSMVELEYLGKKDEPSKTGYVGKLELFKFQSKNGKVVIFHQYQHPASYVKDWTEADIGKKIYGAISSVCVTNQSTYACIKNDWCGYQFGITGLTTIKPNRYWEYYDIPEASTKQEGENTQNVLPFRAPQQAPAESNPKDGESESKGSVILLSEDATIADFMNQKVYIANGFMIQKDYIEACTLNGARCSECARSLVNIEARNVWLYTHHDRESGSSFEYLHCSRRCMIANKEECDMIDQDYDRKYGGTDDV